MAFDVMQEIGHHPNYLIHDHTVNNFKTCFTLWDREKLQLQKTFSTEALPEANRMARRLLNEHAVRPLEMKLAEEGESLLTAYVEKARTIGKKGG